MKTARDEMLGVQAVGGGC